MIQPETPQDIGTGPDAEWRLWQARISHARRREESWRKRAKEVLERYRDEADRTTSRFNILWSNVETLTSALYVRAPKPDVSRRYRDADPLGKVAAMALERALSYAMDEYDFDDTALQCIQDLLLPGRAVARVRYVPVDDGEQVVYEQVRCEYVHWQDFLMFGGPRWEGVTAVAFRHRYTRAEVRENFGKVEIDPDTEGEDMAQVKPEERSYFARCTVWEIWDADDGMVKWWAPGHDGGLLKKEEFPLKLQGRFPCPRPMYAVRTNDSPVPIPEYTLYQDQADELDRITGRIDKLISALKLRGVYNAAMHELANLLTAGDNQMIAVENWGALMEKGGLEAMMATAPVERVAQVLLGLYQQREQTKQAIYELTGIADVIRGASDPSETATAQNIKARFGSLRLEKRKAEVKRFFRNLIELKAEVIAEQFGPDTLQAMTGLPLPSPEEKQALEIQVQQAQATGQPVPPEAAEMLRRPTWPEVVELLRQDGPRSFRIDVETDETIAADSAEEQKAATDFLSATMQYLTAAAPLVIQGVMPPQTAKSLLLAAARRFRFGRDVEDAIEQIGGETDGLSPPQPPPPAPEQQQAQAQAEMEAEVQRRELAMREQEQQAKLEMEREQLRQRDAEMRLAAGDAGGVFEQDMQQLAMAIQQLAQAVAMGQQQQAQQQVQTQQALVQLAAALTAPKRIVRDEQGRPVGVAVG